MMNELIIDRVWNNIDFWHIFFLTVVISLVIIKIMSFLDSKVGAFQKYKSHDLAIYKKTTAFFSENDIMMFLNDLQENKRYRKPTMQQIGDFESLMTTPSNVYKSEILRRTIDELLKDINTLKHFLVVNFSEVIAGSNSAEDYLVLLPETKKDLTSETKSEIYGQDDLISQKSQKLDAEKQAFYAQKERELKEIVDRLKNEYGAYRGIIKRYLNV
jgi:hypothetical protein